MLHYDVDCPNCHARIHIPFFRKLEAKAIEDFDMAEISAQEKLLGLRLWLREASLLALLKHWFKRVA